MNNHENRIAKMDAARGRMRLPDMNRTEAAYAEQLEIRRRAGEISWYKFEAVKLKLAENTTYTPDFLVMLSNGELEAHEVKGFWRDDARVKIKIAAAIFPFRFIAISAIAKRRGGGWETENF